MSFYGTSGQSNQCRLLGSQFCFYMGFYLAMVRPPLQESSGEYRQTDGESFRQYSFTRVQLANVQTLYRPGHSHAGSVAPDR